MDLLKCLDFILLYTWSEQNLLKVYIQFIHDQNVFTIDVFHEPTFQIKCMTCIMHKTWKELIYLFGFLKDFQILYNRIYIMRTICSWIFLCFVDTYLLQTLILTQTYTVRPLISIFFGMTQKLMLMRGLHKWEVDFG